MQKGRRPGERGFLGFSRRLKKNVLARRAESSSTSVEIQFRLEESPVEGRAF